MTPADFAMKAALDESARYADSLPTLAHAAHPLVGQPPNPNVTSFGLQSRKSSDPFKHSQERPNTPHVTPHQLHRLQPTSAPSTSPDLDYKRVRRKQSLTNLIRLPAEFERQPAQFGSSSTLAHSGPALSLLPSLLPPLPYTSSPQPNPYSPSLSSTVDTLQSTPTYTPIQRDYWPAEQWEGVSEGNCGLVRTKRKFLPYKQAKRLPHRLEEYGIGEGTWEVHAAVIEIGLGIGDLRELGGRERRHGGAIESEELEDWPLSTQREGISASRRARLVRFEGVQTEESSSGTEDPTSPHSARSGHEQQPTLTSSFSLSKYNFPAPPGKRWAGTFGKALLAHYKRIEFC